jgi:hypothetical protein
LHGDQGLNILASGAPAFETVACDSSAPVDAIETTVTAGSSSLGYDAIIDTYTYTWKTDKSWAGTRRPLQSKLTDGTVHKADFKFK